jgi:two-component system OmpR family sensor kinase
VKSLTFRAKTAIGSFLLVSIFLGFVGIIAENILTGLNRTAASRTLQNEVQSISTTLEALPEGPSYDQFDPLPPGQVGLIESPTNQQLLNSLRQFKTNEISILRALPINQIRKFDNSEGTFWVLNSRIEGPGGQWQVLVLQNNDYGTLLTKRTSLFFLFLGLGLLIMSTVGAWILASFVLKPVREMQQHAQTMILSEERHALPVPDPRDELRDLATTLNELLDRLHQGLEREKRLVADVSHELRTPLSILQMRFELLEAEEIDGYARVEINNLSRTTKQMSSLVDNLLYLARKDIARENQPISPESVRSLIPVVIDNARILAAEKNVEIDFDIEIDSGPDISAEAMQRVLTNLLSNAINASDANGKIQLSLIEQTNSIVLLIDDEGIGFPPEFLPVAFERFTRPDTSRTRDTGGSGLGLSLVKSILDTFGAQIKLSNLKPSGARVEVFFNKLPYPNT